LFTVTGSKAESSGESKIWPPPKAPDYLQSVKQLPSYVKVGDTETPDQKHKGGNSATSQSQSSDKDETGSITSKASDSGTVNTYSRQNSGEGGNNIVFISRIPLID